MAFKSYREESKVDYGQHNPLSAATLQQINTGSLQRIADATEKMAASYDQMRRDRDNWKSMAEDRRVRVEELRRSNASLRGVVTRLKKKLLTAGIG